MKVILHLPCQRVEFQTDDQGDLHLYASGTAPDIAPVSLATDELKQQLKEAQEHHREEWEKTVPRIVEAEETPRTAEEKLQQIISQDEGWT
jgi:hypothetical protein